MAGVHCDVIDSFTLYGVGIVVLYRPCHIELLKAKAVRYCSVLAAVSSYEF